MHANAQRKYFPSFVGYADIDQANMSWEKRAQETHPGDNDRKRLIVAEENIGLIGRGAEIRSEGARGFLRRS